MTSVACQQIVSLILILYSFSLITSASNCHEYWDLAMSYNCVELQTLLMNRTTNAVTFESPNRDLRIARVQHILFHVVLLTQCLMALFQTTLSGASAYEEVKSCYL